MRDPKAIVGNLNEGNMLMGPSFNNQITGGPQKMIAGGPSGSRGGASSGTMQLYGGGGSYAVANQQLDALALFNMPHKFGK